MKTTRILKGVLLLLISFSSNANLSKVKKEMIHNSISNYSGRCPCPYNRTKRGHRCGKRSAYSKPGGASPLCYEEDISDESAREYLGKKKF